MKKKLLLLRPVLIALIFCFGAYLAQAQKQTVSGKVTSADDNASIPGVNIVVKNTTTGTVTDVNGAYTLQVAHDATLVFSSISFTTQEIPVESRPVIHVLLSPDVQSLEEVVVVGYGSRVKTKLTSAIFCLPVCACWISMAA